MTQGHAEQQLFNFYVNGAASNDVTNAAYGGTQTGYMTGGFRSYRGPAQGPHDNPVIPGGFTTTSSGPGAISEAQAVHGTNGSAITGAAANDAYDGYGGIGFRQAGAIVLNFGGLTVTRAVDVTHGPDDVATPITVQFATAGVANAARWVDTVTNPTSTTISGTISYFNNLGSDSNTRFVGSSSGNTAATTGNLFLTSNQNGVPSDPVITHVLGNNAYTLTTATMIHADGNNSPEWQYPVTVAPGQTRIVILFNVLTADVNYDPAHASSDIALGAELANLITNNGAPISADSTSFSFFSDLTRAQLQSVINYDFVGLTLDTSRPFFIETDYAVTHGPIEFDGGTLKPTASASFSLPVTVNSAGGTIDNTNGNQTFTGVMSGVGGLTFTGSSKTTLTAANTYSGGTTIGGGKLIVGENAADSSATLAGSIDVLDGATLGGYGTVGDGSGSLVSVAYGGTIAPGNSIGTLSVNGGVAFATGSFYSVELAGDGSSDQLKVTGSAALGGAKVELTAIDPETSYRSGQTYRILTADGGVSGAFDPAVLTNSAFLDTTLDQSADAVDLTIAIKDTTSTPEPQLFTTVAQSGNQKQTAGALDTLAQSGASLALYNKLLMLNADQARTAFDDLSGEVHSSVKSASINDSHFLGDAMNDRMRATFDTVAASDTPVLAYADAPAPRVASSAINAVMAPADTDRMAAWTSAIGNWGQYDGNGNSGQLDTTDRGFLAGVDGQISDNLRFGLMGGYSYTSFDTESRSSSANSDNYHIGLYAGSQWGQLNFRTGTAYTFQNISSKRMVSFTGFSEEEAGEYNAGAAQVFGEFAYDIKTGQVGLEPFANLSYVNLHTSGFSESGGAAALSSPSDTTSTTFSTLGLRASTDFLLGFSAFQAHGMIGWRHAYGDTASSTQLNFATSDSFTTTGNPSSQDTALLEAGLNVKLSRSATFGVSYQGAVASNARQNGIDAHLNVKF